jgi:hypothetical protein
MREAVTIGGVGLMGAPMSNEPAEAVFHAGMLLQLYDETKSVEEVAQVATTLLAARPEDHVRRVAWFLPAELLQALPKQNRGRIVPLQPSC